MIVRFICPARNLSLKVKYFHAKLFISRSLSTPQLPGAFWSSFLFSILRVILTTTWSMVSRPWSCQVKNADNHYGMKVYVDGESCILTKHIVDPAPAVVHRQVAYSWALCKWQNLCILWPPIESLKFTYYYFPIFKLQPVNSNTLLRHLHSLTAITEINQN